MLTLLSKYKPDNQTLEEFQIAWKNGHTLLEPLGKAVKELGQGKGVYSRTTFEDEHAFGVMAYDAGYLKAINDILALLPKNIDI